MKTTQTLITAIVAGIACTGLGCGSAPDSSIDQETGPTTNASASQQPVGSKVSPSKVGSSKLRRQNGDFGYSCWSLSYTAGTSDLWMWCDDGNGGANYVGISLNDFVYNGNGLLNFGGNGYLATCDTNNTYVSESIFVCSGSQSPYLEAYCRKINGSWQWSPVLCLNNCIANYGGNLAYVC